MSQNPDDLTRDVNNVRVRVINDTEGDLFVNFIDLRTAVVALIELQAKAGNLVMPPEINDIAVGAQGALAQNMLSLVADPARHIKPPSVDDVPDVLPEGWL